MLGDLMNGRAKESRRYDDAFWKELLGGKGNAKRSEAESMKELGF